VHPHFPRNHNLLFASLTSIALLTLVACGSGTRTAHPKPSSAGNTSSISTSSPTSTALSTKRDAAVGGDELATHVTRAISMAGSARFAILDAATAGTGAFDLRSGFRMSYKVNEPDQTRVIAIPGGLYLSNGGLVHGRPWVYFNGRTESKSYRETQGALLRDVTSVDPLMQAKAWHSVGWFTVIGSSSVRGVPTTEYYGAVWTKHYIAVYPPLARRQLSDLVKDVQVWVFLDANDLPVRVRTVIHHQNSDDALETTYSSWGKPVRVVVPVRSLVAIVR
jgi:hypothetical protein